MRSDDEAVGRRDPFWLLLKEWARVSPEFLSWWTKTIGAASGGMVRIPIPRARIPAALAAVSSLPDGAGERAVRAALAPFWDMTEPGPFELGV